MRVYERRDGMGGKGSKRVQLDTSCDILVRDTVSFPLAFCGHSGSSFSATRIPQRPASPGSHRTLVRCVSSRRPRVAADLPVLLIVLVYVYRRREKSSGASVLLQWHFSILEKVSCYPSCTFICHRHSREFDISFRVVRNCIDIFSNMIL